MARMRFKIPDSYDAPLPTAITQHNKPSLRRIWFVCEWSEPVHSDTPTNLAYSLNWFGYHPAGYGPFTLKKGIKDAAGEPLILETPDALSPEDQLSRIWIWTCFDSSD